MTLVEIDVVGTQAAERVADLLLDLLAREALVSSAVVHREIELRREDVGIARPRREHLAEELLCAAARVITMRFPASELEK